MSQEALPVTVRILDKEYRVACQPSEQEGLIESARMLDHRMREIHQTGRVIGTDRIAVMAALNIAHELIQAKHKRGETSEETNRRLSDLQDRIAEALADQHRLDVHPESV